MDKSEIREKINSARKNLSEEIISEKSRLIIEKLRELKEYTDAKTIMFYVSLDNEVNTRELIKNELSKKEKTVVVPFVNGDDIEISKLNDFNNLTKGNFGVLEPEKKEKYNNEIDLVIIPGVAFDENGNRIGFGKGYYDKFLGKSNSLKIALAFEEQIVNLIPTEEHDKPVDMIITEKRIIRCN